MVFGGFLRQEVVVSDARTAQGCPAAADRAALWRALNESSGAAVLVLDVDGRIIEANDAAGLLFRRQAAEMRDRLLTGVLSEAFVQGWLRRVRRCAADQQPILGAMFLNGQIVRESLYPLGTGGLATPQVLAVLVRNTDPVDFNALIPSGGGMARRDALGRLSVLTNRELEILSLIGQGLRTKEMAARLVRSERTLHGHCAAIARKLRLKGRADMAAVAAGAGLIVNPIPHS